MVSIYLRRGVRMFCHILCCKLLCISFNLLCIFVQIHILNIYLRSRSSVYFGYLFQDYCSFASYQLCLFGYNRHYGWCQLIRRRHQNMPHVRITPTLSALLSEGLQGLCYVMPAIRGIIFLSAYFALMLVLSAYTTVTFNFCSLVKSNVF